MKSNLTLKQQDLVEKYLVLKAKETKIKVEMNEIKPKIIKILQTKDRFHKTFKLKLILGSSHYFSIVNASKELPKSILKRVSKFISIYEFKTIKVERVLK